MDNGFVSANKFSFAVTVKAPAVACCALGVLLAVSSDVEFDMIGIPLGSEVLVAAEGQWSGLG